MDKTRLNELIQKYRDGNASPQEIGDLHTWYRQTSAVDGIYPDHEEEVKDRMLNRLLSTIQPAPQQRFSRYKYAAAIVILGLTAMFYFIISDLPEKRGAKTLAPGSNKAVLTLTNGEIIKLDNHQSGIIAQAGTFIYADGKSILDNRQLDKAQEGTYYTLSTPNGGQYRVTLPDGSIVWLNAASTLKYPAIFSNGARDVELVGEAYFEITPNKQAPFMVHSASQTVEVLGTQFNINAYEDEDATRTTLLGGSVRITSKTNSKTTLLKPNEQSVLRQNEGTLTVYPIDASDVAAWKNGYFQFSQTDVYTAMRQISRWYDAEIEFKEPISPIRFSGKIKRDASIKSMLDQLSYFGLTFKIDGKRILVSESRPPKDG